MEWLNNAHGETRRMGRLVDDLLMLARSDSGVAPIRTDPVDADELLQHVGDLIEPIAAGKGLELQVTATANAIISGDRDRLQQLLIILLDNACKYTPAGGRVELHSSWQKGTVVWRVVDTGVGIAPADLPHVFERFSRADQAREHDEVGGSGLGLSIAKWIVEAHRGRIHIASPETGGTEVTVQLPANPRPAA